MSRQIIKKHQAAREALAFAPSQFDRTTSAKEVEKYVEEAKAQALGRDFKMSEVVRKFTGFAEIESEKMKAEVERRTLESLKQIEEQAYSEAYQLGLDEGKKEAFLAAEKEISEKLKDLGSLIETIKHLKTQLVQYNEASIMKLIYYFASRIAMFEIAQNPNAIISVVREATRMAQGDEKIKVLVSPSDFQFLEDLQKETKRELDFLKGIEFKEEPDIEAGGCVVQTNYGEVDAQIKARVDQLFEAIKDTIPMSKDKAG